MTSMRLAVVGAGNRAHHLVHEIYAVRDREYVYSAEDEWGIVSEKAYEKHSINVPEWAREIGQLDPKITDLFDPDRGATEDLASLCADHGDDPTQYDSFEALVEEGTYDAVVLASPNHAHVEQATALLDRDIDFFCEKPIALTLEEHDVLIDADKRSSSLFYVGFNLRAHPVYSKIAELIHDGTIGELGMLSSQNVRVPFPDGFRYSTEHSGGSILEKNCHDFDLYNWCTGADPERVAAIGGQRVLSEGTDVLDHATVIVQYDNGVKATLELSLFSPFTQHSHRSYFVRGDDGIIQTPSEDGAVDVFKRTTANRIQTRAYVAGDGDSGHGGADYMQIIRFLQCLEGEATRPASPVDAKKAGAIAIAAQESIRNGPFYRINEDYDIEQE